MVGTDSGKIHSLDGNRGLPWLYHSGGARMNHQVWIKTMVAVDHGATSELQVRVFQGELSDGFSLEKGTLYFEGQFPGVGMMKFPCTVGTVLIRHSVPGIGNPMHVPVGHIFATQEEAENFKGIA